MMLVAHVYWFILTHVVLRLLLVLKSLKLHLLLLKHHILLKLLVVHHVVMEVLSLDLLLHLVKLTTLVRLRSLTLGRFLCLWSTIWFLSLWGKVLKYRSVSINLRCCLFTWFNIDRAWQDRKRLRNRTKVADWVKWQRTLNVERTSCFLSPLSASMRSWSWSCDHSWNSGGRTNLSSTLGICLWSSSVSQTLFWPCALFFNHWLLLLKLLLIMHHKSLLVCNFLLIHDALRLHFHLLHLLLA